MKSKKISRKLEFKKSTVSNLDSSSLGKVYGGLTQEGPGCIDPGGLVTEKTCTQLGGTCTCETCNTFCPFTCATFCCTYPLCP